MLAAGQQRHRSTVAETAHINSARVRTPLEPSTAIMWSHMEASWRDALTNHHGNLHAIRLSVRQLSSMRLCKAAAAFQDTDVRGH